MHRTTFLVPARAGSWFLGIAVLCIGSGLVLAAGNDPGPRDLTTSNRASADGPPVSTNVSDLSTKAINHGRIDAELVQVPGCPWDCADPPDGDVGILDFLELLAQWDQVGTSCDFDGGGVGIVDFLKLQANWGPCPPDKVTFFLGQTTFDRATAKAGMLLKLKWNFNPHALAAVSEVVVPDPLDISTHVGSPSDPWTLVPAREKCFDQPPNQFNGIFSDLDCDFCGGETQVVADQIVLATAESLVVLKFWGGYFPGDAGGGDPLPDNFTVKIREDDKIDPGQPGVVIRKIPVGPATTRTETGQILFGVREFEYTIDLEPNQDLEPGMYWVEIYNDTAADPTDDTWFWVTGFLDLVNGLPGSAFSGDPPNRPGETWTIDAVQNLSLSITCKSGDPDEDLWPPQVDNIRFTSNLNPQGALNPGNNLAFATSGFSPDIPNDMLRETTNSGSIDVISGPPAGDNHTAMAFRINGTIIGSPPGMSPVLFHVTVYDKQDAQIGKITIDSFNGTKVFVGFITTDPKISIGRVDVWDSNGSSEGISFIWAYQNAPAGDG